MAKVTVQRKPSGFARDRSLCIASISVILILCALWTIFLHPLPSFSTLLYKISAKDNPTTAQSFRMCQEGNDTTFYDDPENTYTIHKHMVNWDSKRKHWLEHHPSFTAGMDSRVLVLTGSQPKPCEHPSGDHLLLRFFKNKVDYCRIHGYDISYSNAFLHPKMRSYWVKIPLVRAAMMVHPEAEWIFWVDADAIFTDMRFKIPLEKYKDHNLVINGWPALIYEKKSWSAINAGLFLIRNCQWSMDFLDVWARMGPQTPEYSKWGQILRTTLTDMTFPEHDDQAALVYLMLKGKKKWVDMIYIENEYSLHGYWGDIVGRFENITRKYVEIERSVPRLRRRHAEVVEERYGAEEEPYVEQVGWRRPFVTHFTGCKPCSGHNNPDDWWDACWVGMERALNFADNQVIKNFGFVHPDIGNGSYIAPVAFDFPPK